MNDLIKRIEKLMGPRQFLSPVELVKMGIYGSRTAVWRAVRLGQIDAIQISDRRWVIIKESIIKHIKSRQEN